MRLHKEGTRSIILVSLITLLSWYAALTWLIDFPIIKILACLLMLTVLFIVVYFFRIDKREVNFDENAILASCDGKVVAIEPISEPEYFNGEEKLQISIFMSPLNIHANWWPVNGTVEYYKHHNGKFRFAWHPKSSTENERSSIVAKAKNGNEVLIRQIAGALARRIVTYASKKQKTKQGTELGFIKFGSRIDFILPIDVKVNVKIDEVVTGTKSVIAYWK